jgi:hypothetical protein
MDALGELFVPEEVLGATVVYMGKGKGGKGGKGKGGWPSKTGKPSGKGRSNAPSKKGKDK